MKKWQEKEFENFIKRTKTPEFKKQTDEYHTEMNLINNSWQRKNPDKHRLCIKKYYQSDKGAYAVSKRNASRRKKFKDSCMDLTWEERKLIGKFYKNCPEGYEVDHIIPISKGGKHILSYLQYLTKEENRKKSAKLNWIK